MNPAPMDPALPRGLSFDPDVIARQVYLLPDGLLSGPAAAAMAESGRALRLAGGPAAFTAVRLLLRAAETGPVAAFPMLLGELRAWAAAAGAPVAAHVDGLLARIAAPRAPFAGLDLSAPRIMGILNVTPDSFSDGGDFVDASAAISHGLALRAAGADIVDIGGESTRPGSEPVPVEEELRRVLPVAEALAREGVLVSIDSRRAAVMRAALAAGACIVNDVTALAGDPDSLAVAVESGAAVVLMHMQGEPRSMQRDPTYRHAPADIYDVLADRVAACRRAGIAPGNIAVDPGIGFGKTLGHNLQLLDGLALFAGLGSAVMLGVSRKGFIGRVAGVAEPKERLPGSLAAGLAGLDRGAQLLRVHDVAETRQAVAVRNAILAGDAG